MCGPLWKISKEGKGSTAMKHFASKSLNLKVECDLGCYVNGFLSRHREGYNWETRYDCARRSAFNREHPLERHVEQTGG